MYQGLSVYSKPECEPTLDGIIQGSDKGLLTRAENLRVSKYLWILLYTCGSELLLVGHLQRCSATIIYY